MYLHIFGVDDIITVCSLIISAPYFRDFFYYPLRKTIFFVIDIPSFLAFLKYVISFLSIIDLCLLYNNIIHIHVIYSLPYIINLIWLVGMNQNINNYGTVHNNV